jgi:exonuclease VII small subunit
LTFKLFALELLVIDLLVAIHLLRSDPLSDAKRHRNSVQKRLAETKLPLDEAVSDFVTGGLAAAADKILQEVEVEVARKLTVAPEQAPQETTSP